VYRQAICSRPKYACKYTALLVYTAWQHAIYFAPRFTVPNHPFSLLSLRYRFQKEESEEGGGKEKKKKENRKKRKKEKKS
jgi:hypothetical protein